MGSMSEIEFNVVRNSCKSEYYPLCKGSSCRRHLCLL